MKSSHPTLSPKIMEFHDYGRKGRVLEAEIVQPTQDENAGGPSQAVLCAEMQRDVLNFRISES